MIRNRFAVTIVFIALLGFTLTPHAYFPCCCKGVGKVCQGLPSGFQPEKPVKQCCAQATNRDACPVNDTVKADCPNCRCLEQYQIVVLTGPGAGDPTVRIPAAGVLPAFSAGLADINDRRVQPARNEFPPGTAIRLKTCTLLC